MPDPNKSWSYQDKKDFEKGATGGKGLGVDYGEVLKKKVSRWFSDTAEGRKELARKMIRKTSAEAKEK